MKGIIFSELLELVDDRFGIEITERLLERSSLPSAGIYTSVGTYDFAELATLLTNLVTLTSIPAPALLRAFGGHLFQRFRTTFPEFFEGVTSSFQFLPRVDGFVHVEVRKLYPDAELPSFTCDTSAAGRLVMTYRSTRPLADLAEGMIIACIDHFHESLTVVRDDAQGHDGETRFVVTER